MENAKPNEQALKNKLSRIICCPACHHPLGQITSENTTCTNCTANYPVHGGIPLLIEPHNELREKYIKPRPSASVLKKVIKSIPKPNDRLWTRRSRKAIKKALDSVNPDEHDSIVLNLGAGLGPAFKKLLAPYSSVIRVGLPHAGRVDAYCDAHKVPVLDGTVDLFLSSSIIEHLEDPERAVSEMSRVIRPEGLVYAEVPFLRAYHMPPIDYQRYTISGLEKLFNRHGFKLIEKGICSGPFNAWVLLLSDFLVVIAPRGLKFIIRTVLAYILHPLKYADLIFENTKWAQFHACNFYYLGKKKE